MAPLIELFAGRVQHYVFTSSQAVYRRSYVQPLRETSGRHAPDNTDPRSAYGVGKVQCEDHLFELARSERLPVDHPARRPHAGAAQPGRRPGTRRCSHASRPAGRS